MLDNVAFNIPKGAVTGFVGNNGSGKTTTIKCIFDFVKPDVGEIFFFEEKFEKFQRSRLGYLPERPYLYEFLKAEDFLRLHWRLCYGTGKSSQFLARAGEVLEQVGLSEHRHRRLRDFSKGMLQRIGIAQAILTDPELLILDEPMSGLDPDGRSLVKDILKQQRDKGVSLFFSSHLLQDMEEICTHLVVIDRGQILYCGEMHNFIKEYENLEQAFRVLKRGPR